MRFLESVQRRLPQYPPYYEAPGGQLLRLDQNANLLGPHPAAAEVDLDLTRIHLYPSRDNTPLVDAAAQAFRTDPKSVFVSNGSDEALDIIVRTLVEPGGRVVSPHPSYSMYPHLCRLSRTTYVPVAFDAEFHVGAPALLNAQPDLVLLANPNNPTGTLLDARVVGQVLEGFDGPVVVDEAYAEFSGTSLIPLLPRYPNLVVTRTLSKAVGLAGLRVGFGFAHPDVAELIRRNKIPFSVNLLSERIAIEALRRPEPIERAIRILTQEREALARGLTDLGFRVVPGHANFLLTLPPIPSEELYQALKRRGILARVFPHEPSLRDYVRFTVGRAEDNRRLLEALRSLMEAEASA